MVQTRAQVAKSKATQSPEPVAAKITKQPRKQRSVSVTLPEGQEQAGGGAAAAGGSLPQPLADKLLNAAGEAMGQKASAHKKGLGSHPLSSLPTSPAPCPAGSPAPEFTIPAVQAQQAAQPPFPMPTLQGEVEKAASPAVQEEQQQQQQAAATTKPAASVEPRPAAAEQQQQQQPVQQIERQQAAERPLPVRAPCCSADGPCLGWPPSCARCLAAIHTCLFPNTTACLQRPEKLLKPLPDKPVVCDKLPDGPEPVAVEVEYVSRQDLQVGCTTGCRQQLPGCHLDAFAAWLCACSCSMLQRQACSLRLGRVSMLTGC